MPLNSKAKTAFLTLALLSAHPLAFGADQPGFKVLIFGAGEPRAIKEWSLGELKHEKQHSRHEKDPKTGKVIRASGPLFSSVLDASMASLAPAERAKVDLVLVKTSTGARAFIPRSLIVKYPLILSVSSNVALIPPWTTEKGILSENLPIESYFVSGIAEVDLTNYRDQDPGVFLKRQTDPAAMRGEKIFVQNCLACHVSSPAAPFQEKVALLSAKGHPPVPGAPKLAEREKRALEQYAAAYRAENSTSASE